MNREGGSQGRDKSTRELLHEAEEREQVLRDEILRLETRLDGELYHANIDRHQFEYKFLRDGGSESSVVPSSHRERGSQERDISPSRLLNEAEGRAQLLGNQILSLHSRLDYGQRQAWQLVDDERSKLRAQHVKEAFSLRLRYTSNLEDGNREYRVNQYIIKDEIGRGSLGAVHLAVDQYGTEYVSRVYTE